MNLTIILLTIGAIGGFLFGCIVDSDFFLGILGSVIGLLFATLISVLVCGLIIPIAADAAGATHSAEKVEVTPLYALKDKCGGNFKYTENGIKDCSNCSLPHKRDNYDYIIGKFKEIIEITKLESE